VNTLYTIGHSTHSLERLIELLAMHRVGAVADVRSSPYSRYNPQFNREPLTTALERAAVTYVFLGRELGARREESACYRDGKVRFDLVAETPVFQEGLHRLRKGLRAYDVCLLCAEKDPIACHRTILVCRHMRGNGLAIRHILEDGAIEPHEDMERRLMRAVKVPESDLFAGPDELLEKAYTLQGARIACAETDRNVPADAPDGGRS